MALGSACAATTSMGAAGGTIADSLNYP